MSNNMENNEIKLLTISKAAKEMSIGKERIYKLINEGKIGCINMGKKRFIPHTELVRYIKDNTQYITSRTDVFEFSKNSNLSTNSSTIEFNSSELFNKLKENLDNGKYL